MTRTDYENSVCTVALILMLSYSPLKYGMIKNFTQAATQYRETTNRAISVVTCGCKSLYNH